MATRRVVQEQPSLGYDRIHEYPYVDGGWTHYYASIHPATGLHYDPMQCPRFRSLREARAWVREEIH